MLELELELERNKPSWGQQAAWQEVVWAGVDNNYLPPRCKWGLKVKMFCDEIVTSCLCLHTNKQDLITKNYNFVVENIQMASELRRGEIGLIIVFVKSLSPRLTSGNFSRLVVRGGEEILMIMMMIMMIFLGSGGRLSTCLTFPLRFCFTEGEGTETSQHPAWGRRG